MVTVISRFRVRNGLEEEVRQAFLNRPRLVEKAAGFHGLDVLNDVADPSVFLLITRWRDEESFRAWHRSDAHHQSHEFIPPGLKLDASFTSLTVGDSIQDPGGVRNFSDALEGQTLGLSEWLIESEVFLALLLSADGAIRARNRAAARIFPANPEHNSGDSIWYYLGHADADELGRRLAEDLGRSSGALLLNMADEQQNQVTFEVSLIPCRGAILLLGAQERRYESQFQAEVLRLNNELAVMMREAVKKNRELNAANEIIERLSRTDALTGVANRRELDDALRREVARAERQAQPLTVILADVDHFKSINDRCGHATGDRVLARTAGIFEEQLRSYDLAARYGGDEFLILLPGTDTGGAVAAAERVRATAMDLEVAGFSGPITLSLGVATWVRGETPEELMRRVDAALYKAKKQGRNRVEVATAPGEPIAKEGPHDG